MTRHLDTILDAVPTRCDCGHRDCSINQRAHDLRAAHMAFVGLLRDVRAVVATGDERTLTKAVAALKIRFDKEFAP